MTWPGRARVDVLQLDEAVDQQSRADQQRRREADLRQHQQAAQPQTARRAPPERDPPAAIAGAAFVPDTCSAGASPNPMPASDAMASAATSDVAVDAELRDARQQAAAAEVDRELKQPRRLDGRELLDEPDRAVRDGNRRERRRPRRAPTLSVSICRTMRPRPAPMASRTPISRCLAVPRASSRLATLAHAISRTTTTAAASTRICGRSDPRSDP